MAVKHLLTPRGRYVLRRAVRSIAGNPKLYYLNCHPLDDPQLQVCEIWWHLFNFRPNICKSWCLNNQAEHATSRSQRLPTILTFTLGWGRNIFVYFKPPRPGTEPRTLAWKAAVLTTTLGPPPENDYKNYLGNIIKRYMFMQLHICFCFYRNRFAFITLYKLTEWYIYSVINLFNLCWGHDPHQVPYEICENLY